MPKLSGTLSVSPQELNAALQRAKVAMPQLAPLESATVRACQVEADLVVHLPLLGDCDVDLSLSLTESG